MKKKKRIVTVHLQEKDRPKHPDLYHLISLDRALQYCKSKDKKIVSVYDLLSALDDAPFGEVKLYE